jgi:hypothetical protein
MRSAARDRTPAARGRQLRLASLDAANPTVGRDSGRSGPLFSALLVRAWLDGPGRSVPSLLAAAFAVAMVVRAG